MTVGDLRGGVYVEDDGPGIRADERDAVFDPGYITSEEGTGFGLSIVRTIAQANGWQLNLTESADGGARFEFHGVETGETRSAVLGDEPWRRLRDRGGD